jgi:hypothetical protein
LRHWGLDKVAALAAVLLDAAFQVTENSLRGNPMEGQKSLAVLSVVRRPGSSLYWGSFGFPSPRWV